MLSILFSFRNEPLRLKWKFVFISKTVGVKHHQQNTGTKSKNNQSANILYFILNLYSVFVLTSIHLQSGHSTKRNCTSDAEECSNINVNIASNGNIYTILLFILIPSLYTHDTSTLMGNLRLKNGWVYIVHRSIS